MLSVSLLGDFCIKYDEALVTDIDTPRLQSLLAFLILHSETPQSRAHLAFLFWPDTSETQARTNLRNLLHQLRHVLPDADCYLQSSTQTLQWRPDAPFVLDVHEFVDALSQVNEASTKGDVLAFRKALEHVATLYKGDLLPSCYDDWIIPLREELRLAYLNALERLVRALEEEQDYASAIRNAQHILRIDPLHESTYRHLILLYAQNGDRAGALRVYHTCSTVLRRELNVEPSAATREVYQQLLGIEQRPSPSVKTTRTFSPLVGRTHEWTVMLQAWRAVAAGGRPHVIMLSGEAGIGKTRLAEELLEWAARQGVAIANAHCYAAEGELAYAPVTTWLRAHPLPPLDDVWLAEVGRLLPEIFTMRPNLPQPMALTEAWERLRLFEALARATVGIGQPLLLIIEDLQWCDRDTLAWLHFIARFDPNGRLLIVGTYRPEEIGDNHPLLSFLQAMRLEGSVTELELKPLDVEGIKTLATFITGVDVDIQVAQNLYRETEGNPLFVVEILRAGYSFQKNKSDTDRAPELNSRSLPVEGSLPSKIKSILESRLAQLSHSTREVVQLAATIGREFSFKLLAQASGRDEDMLVHNLDEMWQRRIVREHGADAYDFSHDKLREVAYSAMSTARRRFLHHQAAQALETLHALDVKPVSFQIASHYERAGLPEKAVPYYLQGARFARQVYANEETIYLLERGLSLMRKSASVNSTIGDVEGLTARLFEELGEVLELTACHEQALQAFQNAGTQVPQRDRIWQARLYRKIGEVLCEQRRYEDALAMCHQAEAALQEHDGEYSDPWWDEWLEVQVDRIWAHYWLDQWLEMEELVNQVTPVVQERNHATSRMRLLMALCLMHLRRERYVVSEKMLENSREALHLSREWGDLKTRMNCQFELGFLHLWRRELDEAEHDLNATLELAKASGAVWMQTLSLTYLTVLYRFKGHKDKVSGHAVHVQKIAEVAHMPDYVAAAKSNLAWVAWRNGDLATVQQLSQQALAIWRRSPMVYPFQWQTLWPLIAVILAQGCEDEAWAHSKALLEPTQQRLPDNINSVLESAVQMNAINQAKAARSYLDKALALAREMGYL